MLRTSFTVIWSLILWRYFNIFWTERGSHKNINIVRATVKMCVLCILLRCNIQTFIKISNQMELISIVQICCQFCQRKLLSLQHL
jgi:hypothetical protein